FGGGDLASSKLATRVRFPSPAPTAEAQVGTLFPTWALLFLMIAKASVPVACPIVSACPCHSCHWPEPPCTPPRSPCLDLGLHAGRSAPPASRHGPCGTSAP